MKFLVGKRNEMAMRVKLMQPDPQYSIAKENPAVGSPWECIGTVRSSSNGSLSVLWDNGAHNSYKAHELVEVENHNKADGKCMPIWDQPKVFDEF